MAQISNSFVIDADMLLKVRKHKKAIQLCKKGLKLYPDYTVAYTILAKAYHDTFDYKNALATINKAIELSPLSKPLYILKENYQKDLLDSTEKKRKTIRTKSKKILVHVIITIFSLILITTLLPVIFPDWSSVIAENIRTYLGTKFVAQLEEISFSIHDKFEHIMYKAGEDGQMNFTVNPQQENKMLFGLKDTVTMNLWKNGWDVLQKNNDENILFYKKLFPDPDRPFAQVFMVLIRLDKIKIDLSVTGYVPAVKQNDALLGAFNGGFRYEHGKYGLMYNKDIYSQPKNNIGTFFIYSNGTIDIDSWKTGNNIPQNLMSFRQNCPLIVKNGVISDDIYNKNPAIWGFTIDNVQATWRSGVGITKDKRFLIYGLGKSLTVNTLAQAFVDCDVNNAMQLDINRAWTKFLTYSQTEPRTARKIINELCVSKYEYLSVPNDNHKRDFFYLTYKK